MKFCVFVHIWKEFLSGFGKEKKPSKNTKTKPNKPKKPQKNLPPQQIKQKTNQKTQPKQNKDQNTQSFSGKKFVIRGMLLWKNEFLTN